jgi:TET-Associated Glycosyltransferase
LAVADVNSCPIYVCSKGRPDAPLFGLLRKELLRYRVIVEPQDEARYAPLHPGLLVLPENDQGLAYARQFALDHVRNEGGAHYWMLDDDVRSFHEAWNGKNHPRSARRVLGLAEKFSGIAQAKDVEIVSLEYSQFSWNAKVGQVSWNSYCDCAVLIDARTLADYRLQLPLKVDRDFTLSVIASGKRTARLRDLSFQVPTNGSNKGGLHDRYADGIEATASRMMEQLWPGVCEAKVKPNGRPDVKINWRALSR